MKEIEASRKSFDEILHTPEYRKIHEDDSHLEALLKLINTREKASLLDIGTGGGYVACEMAKRWPECPITGVDVAKDSISINQTKAVELKIENAEFYVYEGIQLPFQDGKYDGVICRYAFHHCPEPQITISEMSRVLNAKGVVVLSDPVLTPPDEGDFIDEFQRLLPDGHNCFHQKQALIDMFEKEGFVLFDSFESSVTYPRNMDERYDALLDVTPKVILDAYCIRVENEKVSTTLKVMNGLYTKNV